MAFVLVRSSQSVLVVGGHRELERVQARALADLGINVLELSNLPGQKPVKTVRQQIIAVVEKNDDRREPIASDHPLSVFGNGLFVDRCPALRPGVSADQR